MFNWIEAEVNARLRRAEAAAVAEDRNRHRIDFLNERDAARKQARSRLSAFLSRTVRRDVRSEPVEQGEALAEGRLAAYLR